MEKIRGKENLTPSTYGRGLAAVWNLPHLSFGSDYRLTESWNDCNELLNPQLVEVCTYVLPKKEVFFSSPVRSSMQRRGGEENTC